MEGGGGCYLLAEVERWDMGLVKVMRHSMSSPARSTGPRAMEATTSIIWNNKASSARDDTINLRPLVFVFTPDAKYVLTGCRELVWLTARF